MHSVYFLQLITIDRLVRALNYYVCLVSISFMFCNAIIIYFIQSMYTLSLCSVQRAPPTTIVFGFCREWNMRFSSLHGTWVSFSQVFLMFVSIKNHFSVVKNRNLILFSWKLSQQSSRGQFHWISHEFQEWNFFHYFFIVRMKWWIIITLVRVYFYIWHVAPKLWHLFRN